MIEVSTLSAAPLGEQAKKAAYTTYPGRRMKDTNAEVHASAFSSQRSITTQPPNDMNARSVKMPLLAALAVLGLGFAAAPTSAEAGGCQSRYSHRCGSFQTPIYQSYVRIGYQRCGTPLFRWVTNSHTCRHRGHSSHGHSGYRSSGGGIYFGFSSRSSSYRTPYRSHGSAYRSPYSYRSYGSRCR